MFCKIINDPIVEILANLLRYCSKNLLLAQGVHAASLKTGFGFDVMLHNDLIDMYAKCGVMGNASLVFDIMFERNVVSWTTLMCGHLQIGNARETLTLFFRMNQRSGNYVYCFAGNFGEKKMRGGVSLGKKMGMSW
ncbi:hypothetical protein GQ457_17G002730 [Hibiscus cannabinus]